MKKILYIIIAGMLIIRPVNVGATFYVEEEVELNSGEIKAPAPEPAPPAPEPAPPAPEPVPPAPEPQKNLSSTQPVVTVEEESIKSEPETETTEEVIETESETVKETESEVIEPETEITEEVIETESEAVKETESEVIEPETETTEKVIETESMAADLKPDYSQGQPFDLQNIIGIICILAGLLIAYILMYRNVQIYNLSPNGRYNYIGRCRISKSKKNLRIHISKFVLNRGKSGEYKIVVSKRVLNKKGSNTVFLMLPEHQKIETELREEIQFQYE